MSKLRSDELVNKEGTGGPNFPQGITSIDPTADNHVATKSYVDSTVSFYGGNAISSTAPANPAIGSFWTDTSVAPCTLKVWNGYDWIEFTSDENYTGVIDSPVSVYTPFENDGVPYDYIPTTDIIDSTSQVFLRGMLDQQADVGLVKSPADFTANGTANGSSNISCIVSSAYGKGTYVLLTADEGIAYSTTGGSSWTVIPFPDTATTWNQVIYTGDDNFGGRFVAVGWTAGKQAMWSDDGITWTISTTLPADGYYTDLDIDPVSGRIVAAGVAPQISYSSGQSPYMYSDDGGENWTRSGKTSQNWQGKRCIAYGNGKWVSPSWGQSSPNNASHWPEWSTDGITWNYVTNTSQGAENGFAYETIIFDKDSAQFVAAGSSGNQNAVYTMDGIVWTKSDYGYYSDEGWPSSLETRFTKIAYGNGIYIAAAKGTGNSTQSGYRWSTDLLTWSRTQYFPTKPGGDDSQASKVTSIEFIDDRFVIACADGELFMTPKGATYGTFPEVSTDKTQTSYVNFKSSRIYKLTGEEWVPNFEISDIFGGALPARDMASESDIDVLSVSGTSMEIPSIDGITVGSRLMGTEAVVYGLDPAVVKFSSRNAGSPIVKATDATLAFRRWTLESRASDTDPWTVITVGDDYSPVADQDGVIPWAGRPTLQANTQYRVKVEYHSSNAETVTSDYQYFQVGTTGSGTQLATTGILIEDAQIDTISYEGTTTIMDINLASGVFAEDFDATVGKYVQITGSSFTIANGIFPILDVDAGSTSATSGYITVQLSEYTPPDDAVHNWSDSPESAEIKTQSEAVAAVLGYQERPLTIADVMIESTITNSGTPEMFIKLAPGVFSSDVNADVGDIVRISDLITPGQPTTSMDPANLGSNKSLSNGNLTITSDSDGWSGTFALEQIVPNTGTYYWETSSNSDDVGVIGYTIGLESNIHDASDFWGSTGVWRIFFSTSSVGSLLNIDGNGDSSQIPTFAGQTIGFEYNSDNGLMKVTYDGVEVFSGNVSYAAQSRTNNLMYSNYGSGLVTTFAFNSNSWQYSPSDSNAKELGGSPDLPSEVNGSFEITSINDDETAGPPLELSTFAHEYGTSETDKHQHGATTISGDAYDEAAWVQIQLPYDVSAIKISAERGDAPGEGSRMLNGRYKMVAIYQIKINNSIISTTNYYSGTLVSSGEGITTNHLQGPTNAFKTYSTAHTSESYIYPNFYSSGTSDEVSDALPLGTNSDRYQDLGILTFTPGRVIPAGADIKIKTHISNKITFVAGNKYAAHNGGVITASFAEGASIPTASAENAWSPAGKMEIGAPSTFTDNSGSGDSSSGSGDSSGGSGGGY